MSTYEEECKKFGRIPWYPCPEMPRHGFCMNCRDSKNCYLSNKWDKRNIEMFRCILNELTSKSQHITLLVHGNRHADWVLKEFSDYITICEPNKLPLAMYRTDRYIKFKAKDGESMFIAQPNPVPLEYREPVDESIPFYGMSILTRLGDYKELVQARQTIKQLTKQIIIDSTGIVPDIASIVADYLGT